MQEENRDLRIRFMLNDLTEDEFKKKIQQREKARLRKTDIRQVCELWSAALTDLFQNLNHTGDTRSFIESVNELRQHVNDTMTKVSKRWSNCPTPRVSEN